VLAVGYHLPRSQLQEDGRDAKEDDSSSHVPIDHHLIVSQVPSQSHGEKQNRDKLQAANQGLGHEYGYLEASQ